MKPVEGFNGVALVTRGGTVLLETAAGFADADTGAPCTLDTRFQLASVSKQFAAVATLLLAEQGALSLDDPIGRWLTPCPPAWRDITVHQLLTHTSGLVHWKEVPGYDIREPPPIDEFLGMLRDVPLLSAPGAEFHYSSPGYVLAALIVERAAGEPYARFLARRVFEPLGMHTTLAGADPDREAARGHDADGRPTGLIRDLAAAPGAGDVWSTAPDMTRYAEALRGGRLLAPDSLRAMCTGHAEVGGFLDLPIPAEGRYGYGVLAGTIEGRRAIFHVGDNPGFLSFFASWPELDATAVLLINTEAFEPAVEQLRRALAVIED